MELEVWPSDFGLPSVDGRCLHLMLASRVIPSPVNIVKTLRPWKNLVGSYPVFSVNNEVIRVDFKSFVDRLEKNSEVVSLNGHLDDEAKAECHAYESLVTEKILPAHLHNLWVDNPNFNVVTNKWFGRHLGFPFGLIYVARQRRLADSYLRQLYPSYLTTAEDIEYVVIKRAIHGINLLCAKLGEKKYFFGDKPSSLDILVVGYLAPLLKMPLPNDVLQKHIRKCSNLVRLVDNMLKIYLPLSDEELTEQQHTFPDWETRRNEAQAEMKLKRGSTPEPHTTEADNEYPLRDKIFFGVGAVVLSVLFAVHFGILKIETTSREGVDVEQD